MTGKRAGSDDRVPGIAVTGRTLQRDGLRVPIRDYVLRGPARTPNLLWVHGGGFASGSLRMPESDAVARALAEQSGRDVRAADYRKVPISGYFGVPRLRPHRNIYPAALDDIDAALSDLLERGPVIIGGASAGACLAASVALRRRDRGQQLPSGMFLAYGTFHAALPDVPDGLAKHTKAARGFVFTPARIRRINRNYAGSAAALARGDIFPGDQELTGLPPTLLVDAEHDTLRMSGQKFAAQLAAAGVATTSTMIPGTIHGFLNKPSRPGFDVAITRIATWLDRHDDPQPPENGDHP